MSELQRSTQTNTSAGTSSFVMVEREDGEPVSEQWVVVDNPSAASASEPENSVHRRILQTQRDEMAAEAKREHARDVQYALDRAGGRGRAETNSVKVEEEADDSAAVEDPSSEMPSNSMVNAARVARLAEEQSMVRLQETNRRNETQNLQYIQKHCQGGVAGGGSGGVAERAAALCSCLGASSGFHRSDCAMSTVRGMPSQQ